ncbi:hypothetical protein EB796_010720 [Bugula neritina]|uniref:Uncharacterized protein n=1 Tax=Bugula neritina TaxID=10212 RepID=A0A7J7JX81_BUGNE|nr:hypothetical protein EB796_010720 [Bugula neritina]
MLLLHVVLLTLISAEDMLLCTGEESEYTATDCGGDKYDTYACYFVEQLVEYKPCNDICDQVAVGSTMSRKCEAYCPGWWLVYRFIDCKLYSN